MIFILTSTSCKNIKTESSCEFDFFENSSGIKFPKNVEILDCEDDLEGLIWLHLKFDQKSASEFISQSRMHQYSDKIENIALKAQGSEDDQLIRDVTTYLNGDIEPIPKNQNIYLMSFATEHQFGIYIMNKESGYFWGQITYPDWSGD